MIGHMHTTRTLAAAALVASLLLAGCGGDDGSDEAADRTADPSAAESPAGGEPLEGVDEALEAASPDATVAVPSDEGALTIEAWASGGSTVEPTDPEELAMIMALVGTDAEGFITEDAVVVQASEADATLWCGSVARLDVSTYRLVPVLPDGTGVDCGS